VSHLPLHRSAWLKFNETAAREFFAETEGLSYGFHNFLFGWIDTVEDNYPPLVPSKLGPIVLAFAEKLMPEPMSIFFDQALNKRLGTEGLNIP
jgi:hypothetical protein